MAKDKMEIQSIQQIQQTQLTENGEALFVYPNTGAEVFVAGDFNQWNPRTHRLTKREGMFQRRLKLSPGAHEYKFIVDGEWQTDPAAQEQRPNEFGSLNSVIHI